MPAFGDTARLFSDQDACTADTPLRLSQFRSHSDTKAPKLWCGTMGEFAAHAQEITRKTKKQLPYFAGALFGDHVEKVAIRNGPNIKAVTAVLVDYDEGAVSFDEAAQRLRKAGLGGLLISSASYGVKGERYRVLLPLSGPVQPYERKALVEQVNGLFDGALDGASFNDPIGSYIGTARTVEDDDGNEHEGRSVKVKLVEGAFLDKLPDLPRVPKRGSKVDEDGERVAHDAESLADLIEGMGQDGRGHESVRDFAMTAALRGTPREIVEAVVMQHVHTFDDNARELIESAFRKAEDAPPPPVDPEDAFSDEDVATNVVNMDGDPISDLTGDQGDPFADLHAFENALSRFESAASWAESDPPPRQWYLKHWIPMGAVTLLYGPPGAGKSLLALQLAACGVAGIEAAGLGAPRSGPAMVLASEDDADELHRRIHDIAKGLDLTGRDLDGLHVMKRDEANPVLAVTDARTRLVQPRPIWRDIEQAVEGYCPSILILDTLGNLFAGNENDRSEVTQFMGHLRGLAEKTGIAILLLAHPSKSGESNSKDSGSTAWRGAARSQMYFAPPDVKDGETIDESLRILSRPKSNVAAANKGGVELNYRSGRFVMMGAKDQADRAEAVMGVVVRELRAVIREGHKPSPSKTSRAYGVKLLAEREAMQEARASRKEIERAIGRLIDRAELAVEESGPPSKRVSRYVLKDPHGDSQGSE